MDVPERPESGVAQKILDATKAWTTGIVALATGLAYLLGAWSLSSFATSLGINPTDFAFGTPDFILFAAVNLLGGAIIGGVYVAIVAAAIQITRFSNTPWSAWRRRVVSDQSWRRVVVTFGVGSMTVGATMLIISGAIAIIGVPFLGTVRSSVLQSVLGIGSAVVLGLGVAVILMVPPRRRIGVWLSIASLAALLLYSAVSLLEDSRTWAQDLRRWDGQGSAPTGPIGLSLLVKPSLGYVRVNSSEYCVIRLTDHVFMSADAVIVAPVEGFVTAGTTPCHVVQSATIGPAAG